MIYGDVSCFSMVKGVHTFKACLDIHVFDLSYTQIHSKTYSLRWTHVHLNKPLSVNRPFNSSQFFVLREMSFH